MIDSRDFIAARKRAERETLIPPGPKIVVTGGADYNDHRLISGIGSTRRRRDIST